MSWVAWTQAGTALLLSLAAAGTDWRTGLIPNRLTVSGIAGGLILGALGGGWRGVALALLGALAVGIVPYAIFRKGAIGGGDVKLFAALGALLGAGAGLEAQVVAFGIGALHGMALWARLGCLRAGLCAAGGLLMPPLRRLADGAAAVERARAIEIRFAPAIGLAVFLVLAGRVTGVV